MQKVQVALGPLAAASANNIALSQTPAAAGNLILNGATVVNGVAILDNPRSVLITTTGNETTKTFTIYGTNAAGFATSEVVQGVSSSTVATVNNFKTVTRIAVSAALAAAVTVGTTAVNATDWVRFDNWTDPNVAVQINVSGTVNYTLQTTLDDPNSTTAPVAPSAVNWLPSADTAVVGATATKQTTITFVPSFARVLLNSGTGSITASFIQSGVTNL